MGLQAAVKFIHEQAEVLYIHCGLLHVNPDLTPSRGKTLVGHLGQLVQVHAQVSQQTNNL